MTTRSCKLQKIFSFSAVIGVFFVACNNHQNIQPLPAVSATPFVISEPVTTATLTEIPIPTPIPAKNGWTPEFTASLSNTTASQYTQEEIASILFTQWLDHFKTVNADSRSRLEEYELIKVEIPTNLTFLAKEKDVEFVATFVFSVKPFVYMYSNWNAGNGVSTDNVWIRNKFLIAGVDVADDLYSLVILGTGP